LGIQNYQDFHGFAVSVEEDFMRQESTNSVLLVDDDPDIRELLSNRLEEDGFEARQAEDGIDGLAKLRDELPNAIISDIQMPRMSGIEFVSVVRQRFPSIPVIILSGSGPVELPTGTEPDAWFEKGSLQIQELLRALHDLVGKTPDRVNLPQVASTPARTRQGFAGYSMLTCTECLRIFRVANKTVYKTEESTAICTYCQASVPFLVESPGPS
jgi:CheY-like chemotaxis protein